MPAKMRTSRTDVSNQDSATRPASRSEIQVSGYADQIPSTVVDPSTISVPKGIVDKRMMKTVERQPSLYDYCVGTGMPTSTYLPKALYESLEGLG